MAPDDKTEAGGFFHSLKGDLSLDEVVEEIRRRRGDQIPVEEVGALLRALLSGNLVDKGQGERRLYSELEDLAHFIHAAKAEIAALDPSDIREKFLPTATDELDAIVQATEKATEEIMDACEALDEAADSMEPAASDLVHSTTMRIYEACSFQDLTGQRITKVVRMLGSIEERVAGLVKAFEPHGGMGTSAADSGKDVLQEAANRGRGTAQAVGDQSDDSALLNGPQDDENAMKQNDIDALLKSFD